MANTSIHLPEELLQRLDREAARREVSRNRLIVRYCEEALTGTERDWPTDYFSDRRFTKSELKELRAGFEDWMQKIEASRRSRREPPL